MVCESCVYLYISGRYLSVPAVFRLLVAFQLCPRLWPAHVLALQSTSQNTVMAELLSHFFHTSEVLLKLLEYLTRLRHETPAACQLCIADLEGATVAFDHADCGLEECWTNCFSQHENSSRGTCISSKSRLSCSSSPCRHTESPQKTHCKSAPASSECNSLKRSERAVFSVCRRRRHSGKRPPDWNPTALLHSCLPPSAPALELLHGFGHLFSGDIVWVTGSRQHGPRSALCQVKWLQRCASI